MHKTLLGYELGIILFPITILAILGGGYIVLLMIGEKIWYEPIPAIIYLALTILLLCSLFALWVLGLSVSDGKKFSDKWLKHILFFCNTGAVMSVLCLIAILVNNFGSFFFRQKAEMILVFSIGAPALIPYLHARYILRQSHTKKGD